MNNREKEREREIELGWETQQPIAKARDENQIPYNSAYFGCCNRTVMTRQDIAQPKFCCFCGKALETFSGEDFDPQRLCKKGRYCGQLEGHSGECDDIPF